MESPDSDDHVNQFVLQLLRTGLVLSGLAAELIESLPVDAYPGEEPGAVVVEMLSGTIATALRSADPRDVRRATELMDGAVERTIEHLELACALSRRMEGDGGDRRIHG